MCASLVSFSGVVLAGGRSRRMGTDKALLEVDGVPLWRRHYDLLGRAGAAERFVSVRAGQAWVPAEVARIDDAQPDLGPLAGIVGALERSRCSHVFVLAVDMPRLPLAWCERLRARCVAGVGAVGRIAGEGLIAGEGGYEPLAAFYPREFLLMAARALAEGRLALQPLLGEAVDAGVLRVERIAYEERAWFENWNEPASINARPSP